MRNFFNYTPRMVNEKEDEIKQQQQKIVYRMQNQRVKPFEMEKFTFIYKC